MACVELKLSNGISVSFDADISLSTNSVINYLKNNPDMDYVLNGERITGNLYEYITDNLSNNTTLNTGNLADTLIGNYKLTNTYPELEGTDYDILKLDNRSFISQSYLVSPTRLAVITTEANLDIAEKVMYVYQQLRTDNLAFINLVESLVTDDSLTIYEKFSQIVNTDYDKLQELIKRVPSKYNEELLTIGKNHYALVKGIWKTLKGEIITDNTELWNAYLLKPNSRELSPITLSELKAYSIAEGDEVYTRSNQKLIYNGGIFINVLGEEISDDTIVNRINTIRDQNLINRELEKRTPLSYSKLRFIIDTKLSEYSSGVIFSDSNTVSIENGQVLLKSEYPTNTLFAELAIPMILNTLTKDKRLLEFTNNGNMESVNTLLNALLDFYVNNSDLALSGYDNVEDIKWITDEINQVLDNSDLDVIDNDSTETRPSVQKVSDDTMKKLMEDGNLTIYCVL